ncbi:dynamin family protein [Clostridium uliginosum]|uniref:Dynamin family protein n=1 Tax=Clostridium uliginosum TaxID=119641 RepID=A0A1I1HZ90_9CLOT|nr:dynamin family protein [Clostridium uliginosum]SFC29151.1 Dynamin family protein [Clostridium uliginosum]
MSSIYEKVLVLQQVLKQVPCNAAERLCKSIIRKEQDNRFYLAFVGEFKRGKSTMINSILGQDLLPSDILPTTATINVLEYSYEEYCEVIFTDRESERYELTKENLEKFTAESSIDTDNISHIKIGICNELLKTGMVIIDTPGVNDISKSRVEVTKNILPSCDAAIFLLDAASPLTKSESEFLETKILTYKLQALMFIISKADRLDEDELEESIEGAKSRINKVLGYNAPIMPYSSRKVFKSEREGVINSYKTNLLDYINELRYDAENLKEYSEKENLKYAVKLVIDEIGNIQSINALDREKLQQAQTKVLAMCKQNEVKFDQLILSGEYVGRTTLHEIFDKSFEVFLKNLTKDCIDALRIDNNVKNYYERIMPVVIEKQLRRFGEEKAREIYMYLSKITNHIVNEYNKNFKIPIMEELKFEGVEIPEWQLDYKPSEDLNPFVKNMLPITIGSVIGMIFMPGIGTILGGAAGQIISVSKREKENEQLRAELIGKMPDYLKETLGQYSQGVHESIDKCFDKLFENVRIMNENNNSELNLKLNIEPQENNDMQLKNKNEKLEQLKTELELLVNNI